MNLSHVTNGEIYAWLGAIALLLITTWIAIGISGDHSANNACEQDNFYPAAGSSLRSSSQTPYSAGHFESFGTSWDGASQSFRGSSSGTCVNPTTGLAMSSMGGVDGMGNVFGSNASWNDHGSSASSHFESTHY